MLNARGYFENVTKMLGLKFILKPELMQNR